MALLHLLKTLGTKPLCRTRPHHLVQISVSNKSCHAVPINLKFESELLVFHAFELYQGHFSNYKPKSLLTCDQCSGSVRFDTDPDPRIHTSDTTVLFQRVSSRQQAIRFFLHKSDCRFYIYISLQR